MAEPEYLEKNPLAELAEFLKEESKCFSKSEEFKARAIAAFGEDSWKRYLAKKNKLLTASRIVAELAKVELHYIDGKAVEADLVSANDAVMRCREIAEEGANNG